MKLLVILIVLLLTFAVLVLYSACVVAGEADEQMERWYERDNSQDDE